MTLVDSNVSGNTGLVSEDPEQRNFGGGGGIACAVLTFEGELTLESSEATDNVAPTVGGIASGCMLEMANSTVSGNRATEASGGGIASDGPALLLNSTVANNSAVTGGSGINNFGEMTVVNTIIEGVCEGTVNSGGYNIESPNNTCGFTGTGDQNTVLAGDLNLGLLQDNGGPTLTQAPEFPSAAIDRVPLADCALTSDQRGGSMCDVGAVEVQ